MSFWPFFRILISTMGSLKYPLSNVQVELMKLFSTNLSEKELTELKHLLLNFYAEKAIKTADEVWDKKRLTDDDMDEWLNSKS